MDWITPIIAALLAFLGCSNVWLIRKAGRLRTQVAADLDIFVKMPPGDARDELHAHIDQRVRILIAEQEGMDSGERRKRERGLAAVGYAFLLVVLVGGFVPTGTMPATLTHDAAALVGGLLLAWGAWSYIEALDSRLSRKRKKRALAETPRGSVGSDC